MTIKPQELAELKPAMTPMQLLDQAVSKGAQVETLERLLALQERWEKNQAKKAFDSAMADAKSELPTIFKNREVDFTSQKGRTNYRYEDLAGIAEKVEPILAKNGLSFRYRTQNNATAVTVTCVVSHRDGHSEENSLSAGLDISGNKNSIQAIGSTVTYLQRYTLKAALGLSASNDDDGISLNKKSKAKTKTVTSNEGPKELAQPEPDDMDDSELRYEQDSQPPNKEEKEAPAEAKAAPAKPSPKPQAGAADLFAKLSQPAQMYAAQLDKAAEQGLSRLSEMWAKLHPRYQKELEPLKVEWKLIAQAADEANERMK